MTETTIVYRVEATRGEFEGLGPYHGSPAYSDPLFVVVDHALTRLTNPWDSQHPTPQEDRGLLGMNTSEFCGFESLASAHAWFHSGALRVLLEETDGFYALVLYEVPVSAVRVGRWQVVFRKDAQVSRTVLSSADALADSSSVTDTPTPEEESSARLSE